MAVVSSQAGCANTGVGKFQLLMLLYVGFAWMADAMEMMILSFLGPAVSPFLLALGYRHAFSLAHGLSPTWL